MILRQGEMKDFYRSAGEIVLLPIEQIEPNPVRRGEAYTEAALVSLCDSIAENGLLEPICVTTTGERTFRVIDGERRRRAAEITGMEQIPCLVIGWDETSSPLYALIENGQKQTLHYLEEAKMIQMLLEGSYTLPELAQALSCSMRRIKEKLRLLDLTEEEQTRLLDRCVPEDCALLLSAAEEPLRREVLEALDGEELSRRQIEELLSGRPGKRRGRIFFKNVTVFTNTVERAVETMQNAGVPTEMERRETERTVEYRITVQKIG